MGSSARQMLRFLTVRGLNLRGLSGRALTRAGLYGGLALGLAMLCILVRGTARWNPFERRGESVLTTVAQVRSLSREQAKRALPVDLHGTLTLVDVAGAPLTIQDSTGGISIESAPAASTPPYAGRRLKSRASPGKAISFRSS